MKDIELPEGVAFFAEYGGDVYTAAQVRAAVEADRAQRVLDGWKLVPVEPTEEMLCAGDDVLREAFRDRCIATQTIYDAMLASTPAPAQQERKPMTDEVVREGFAACGVGGINARLGFVEGVKFAERHHGIRE